MKLLSWSSLLGLGLACSLQMPDEDEAFRRSAGAAGRDATLPGGQTSIASGGSTDSSGAGSGGTAGSGFNSESGSGGAPDTSGAGGDVSQPEDGLIAHFTFDEASGSVMQDERNPRRNATCRGSCSRPEGRFGRAVGVRNASSNVDWIELPSGILSGLAEATVSLWVRDLSTNRSGGRLFHFSQDESEELFFAPHDSDPAASTPSAHLGGRHLGSTFVDLRTASTDFTDKRWHQVVVTWNNPAITLYVDGRVAATQANPGVLPLDLGATSTNWLGRTPNDPVIALYAEIDDLRIYDRALTAPDVASLYGAP